MFTTLKEAGPSCRGKKGKAGVVGYPWQTARNPGPPHVTHLKGVKVHNRVGSRGEAGCRGIHGPQALRNGTAIQRRQVPRGKCLGCRQRNVLALTGHGQVIPGRSKLHGVVNGGNSIEEARAEGWDPRIRSILGIAKAAHTPTDESYFHRRMRRWKGGGEVGKRAIYRSGKV
jgi:hypothetical protein